MPEKPLLVLDFDGVIVDGIAEYWASSRQAFIDLLPQDQETIHFPSLEIPKNFKAIRPWVHHGWEMVLLAAECSNSKSRLNLRGIKTFSINYSKECALALQEWKWTPNQLQEALNQARRNAISKDPNQWLKTHKPFPEVVRRLQILDNEKIEFAILTTKSLAFTQKLSQSFDLKPKFIFGHESGSKPEVLTKLLKKHLIKGFIEDRRATLETVLKYRNLQSIPCYLANWGYLKPQDLKNLPSRIELLNLNTFSTPMKNWP